MTVTEQTVRQIFVGDGSADPLAIIIPFFDPDDLLVESELNGVTTTKVRGVDYTVSGGNGNGGTVTPLAVIPNDGTRWVIVRALPQTQEIDLQNQDTVLPTAIEEALDRLVLLLLDSVDGSNRSVKADPGEVNPTGLVMPDLASRINKILQWDSNGDITATLPSELNPNTIDVSTFMETFLTLLTAIAARESLRIFYGTDAGKASNPATPATGDIYFATDTLIVYLYSSGTWNVMSAQQETVTKPNLIINGSAQINQRVNCNGTSTYKNDDYQFCLDHVLLISDTSQAAVVTQNTADAPNGASHCFKLAAAKNNVKFGLMFPLDARQSAALLSSSNDKKCSLRFKHKASSGVQNLYAQVLAWTGTVDAMTDPIANGAWGTAGNKPSLSGTWAYEITGGDDARFLTGTSWATKEIEDIAIDTPAATNVAVIIWVDDTDLVASTDEFFLAEIQLNEGDLLAPYRAPTFRDEWDACIRYYQKSFDLDEMPRQNAGFSGALSWFTNSGLESHYGVQHRYACPMYKTPTLTFYNPGDSNAQWREFSPGTLNQGAVTVFNAGDQGAFFKAGNTNGLVVGDGVAVHFDAKAEITA